MCLQQFRDRCEIQKIVFRLFCILNRIFYVCKLYRMKKIFLTLLLFPAMLPAMAQRYCTARTSDGMNVSLEFCTDDILHVRVSPRDSFSESLLQRYGIIKTDWGREPHVETGHTGGVFTLTTRAVTVMADTENGIMTVADRDGKVLISEMSFIPAGSGDVVKMSALIEDRFRDLKVTSNGGIIGDDDGTFSGKDLTESGDPDKSSMLSVRIADDERFYGGGSTSREHIQHRGELLRMHTTYQHTEIPMPFLVSSHGWGIFNNTTRRNYFDVAYTSPDRLNIYTPYDEADFYIFVGDTMEDVIDSYTLLTGRPYLLPKWAYGLCFGPNMREDQWDILTDAVLFRQTDVPCDVFWLEPQWMEKRYDFSTRKKFNSKLFSPEPYWVEDQYPKKLHNRLFIGKLRNMGYHLGLWFCEEYDLSIQEEDNIAVRQGRDTSGLEHWMDHIKTFIDLGVEGFKLDPARTIDEHTFRHYYNGRDDREMHNLNQVLLPKQMRLLTQNYTGKRSWHHYCAGWSGTQHWGASTSGDNGGGRTALFDQLNLGMSGFMNTSCDVMSVPAEQEMQSLHFGMFLPWVQINSWFSMMQPFYYNDFQQTLYRNAVKLRYELIPYIYSMALEGALTGMPMVRSMPLMFPSDRNLDDCCYQYMFGQWLCVGIFTNEIYLPEGVWTDAWTGERIVSGGETFTRTYPEDRAGLLFIREGAIIPCVEGLKYIGTEPFDTFTVKFYPHGESRYVMYDSDAESYGYEQGRVASTLFESRQEGKSITLTINPVQGSFENMPLLRNFNVEVHTDSSPRKVSVDGVSVSGWRYAEGVLSLSVPAVSADRKVRIEIMTR